MSNVIVSLFDGMRCGYLALDDAGIAVSSYHASEVDKFAMKVANTNYPSCENVGDVREVDGCSFGKVDLLLGGSPCQSFSFAGKRNGMSTKSKEEILSLERYLELKEQGFQFEGQSYLFWEYVRVLKELQETNPQIEFLLENVVMSKKWEEVITNVLGVAPIKLNSLLVTPQNRNRLYWTNINVDQSINPQEVHINNILKLLPKDVFNITSKYHVGAYSSIDLSGYHQRHDKLIKAHSICIIAERGRRLNHNGTKRDDKNGKVIRGYEFMSEVHTNCLTTVQKDNYIYYFGNIYKLTPQFCELLQTVPLNYTRCVSDSQRYKMLGNGWTIKVISYILGCSDNLKENR